LPRARCLPSPRCCLSRIRGRANAPLLFFLLSARFATSLTLVFVLFLQLLASSAGSPAPAEPSADLDPLSSNILALLLDASTVGTRAEDLSPSTGGFRQRFGGFLLAESALFTLLSLLIVADSGARRGAIAFFSSLYAFCHLADLRFSFFFLSFSHQARSPAPAEPFRRLRPTLQQHPRPAPRREHRRHSSGRSFSVGGDPSGGSQASILRQQGNFAEEHAAVALVAAKKCFVSDKDVVKTRA
jgi:hypothetical protein